MRTQDDALPASVSPVSAAEFSSRISAFSPSKNIAVAFSGGPDSLALLILAARWAKRRKGITLHAFTVDHGLRKEAAAEARYAGSLAQVLGVPHRILRWKGEKPASGIQAAAREARYRLLLEACRKAGVGDLLVAHHLEDQAETFLLRLARGSGVDGLTAMKPVRLLSEGEPHVRLLRPLLDLPRERLHATVARSGLVPVSDPSNENERFDRVKARKIAEHLAPLGLDAARLARMAGHMARAREALEGAVADLLAAHATLSPYGHMEMDADAFTGARAEIGLRALATAIRIAGGADYAPRLNALEAVHAALLAGELGGGRTLAGVKIAAKGGRILFTREVAGARKAASLLLAPGEEGVWDGRFHIRLLKAPKRARLEVRALGQEGLAFLHARKVRLPAVPSAILQVLPGLWRDAECVVVPHFETDIKGIAWDMTLRRSLPPRA